MPSASPGAGRGANYFFDQEAGGRLRGGAKARSGPRTTVSPSGSTTAKIRQSADQRLASIWFGEANRTKAPALTVTVEMLSHFRN